MASPAQTITVALDMSKAFDTINIHTLIITFITNYINGRKAYTPYRNHTSSQLFNIYTADSPARAPVQVMSCKACRMQHLELPQDAPKTQIYNICITNKTLILHINEHLQFHASQYKQKTQHPSDPLHKHTIYFKAQNPLSSTTAATQQTFPHTPTQSVQQS